MLLLRQCVFGIHWFKDTIGSADVSSATSPKEYWRSLEELADSPIVRTVRNGGGNFVFLGARAYEFPRTADGGYMAMACVEPKFWSRFRQLSGLDELGDDATLACTGST